MALLSTLRSQAHRLWSRFWWLLGYTPLGPFLCCAQVVPLSPPLSLNSLNDDCLLFLLDSLPVSQLFPLRPVSRRLCHLIEGVCLRQYRTLLYGYEESDQGEPKQAAFIGPAPNPALHVQAMLSRPFQAYSHFCVRYGFGVYHHERYFPHHAHLLSLRLAALPLSLPRLLPRLSSLTLTYFIADGEEEQLSQAQVQAQAQAQVQVQAQAQLTVNRLATSYLASHWSTTLVSLHLYIQVPSSPKPDKASSSFFSSLNTLHALKHLFLDFPPPEEIPTTVLLPASMPILGQLESFSLHNAYGANTATLLRQLGPKLVFLSLHCVTCTVEEFVAFLGAKAATYGRTLKTLEVNLNDSRDWRLFTVPVQCLPLLEHFVFYADMELEDDLLTVFRQLSRLSNLRDMCGLYLSMDRLGALHQRLSLPGEPALLLPRLTHIRRATLVIRVSEDEQPILDETKLANQALPLLATVFCALDTLLLTVFKVTLDGAKPLYLPFPETLSAKVKELFPALDVSILRFISKVE